MWSWIVVGVLYVCGLAFFQLLGGLSSAARGLQRWGAWASERRRAEMEARLAARRLGR